MQVIDFRVRPPVKPFSSTFTEWPDHLKAYVDVFKLSEIVKENNGKEPFISIDEFFQLMDKSSVNKAVVFATDTEKTGGSKITNNDVSDFVKKYPDRFIGFAGIDPNKGMDAVRELDVAVRDLGLKGLNVTPCSHKLRSNDKKFYPVYAKCVELDIPIAMHTGINFSTELPIDFGNPIYLDEVGCDFPELKIIMTHAAWPWTAEACALAWKNKNVYLDISSVAPKYIGSSRSGWDPVFQFANSILQDQILFGTNWPMIPFDRSIREFLELPFKEEVKEKILHKNAFKLLQL